MINWVNQILYYAVLFFFFFFFLVSFCVSSLPINDLDFWLNTFMLHFLVSSCVSSLPINFTNQFYSLVGFLVEYIHAAFYWKYLLFAETL